MRAHGFGTQLHLLKVRSWLVQKWVPHFSETLLFETQCFHVVQNKCMFHRFLFFEHNLAVAWQEDFDLSANVLVTNGGRKQNKSYKCFSEVCVLNLLCSRLC